MRVVLALVALLAAVLGGVAAILVGRATGLIEPGKTTTVVVNGARPLQAAPAAVRTAAPDVVRGFDPARIFRERAAGVVTIFSTIGGEGAQGSGFVVRRDGTILTNAHVITNAGEQNPGAPVRAASSVYVEFPDHDRVPARILGWDVFDDVGVIRVDPKAHPLDVVPLGRSDGAVVGEPVAAIGSPLGNETSLAVGVVSAVGRSIDSLTAPHYQLIDAIQTDAPITHGSSGGPLFDAAGRVIGINAQIRSAAGGGNDVGIGFAVPIDSARRSLGEIVAGGRVAYAYAGLQTEDLTPALGRRLGLPVRHGALVDGVTSGGPAAVAGIRGGTHDEQLDGEPVRVGGDVIVAVGGVPVTSADDLVRIVTDRLRPGKLAVFTVQRGKQRLEVPVRLAERPTNPRLP